MAGAKYALVTGGNRGIGLEVCKALVAKGKPLLFTARNPEQGDVLECARKTTNAVTLVCGTNAGRSVAQGLLASAAPSAVVKCLQLDAADSSSITALAAAVRQDYDQQIDLVVNNAGILFGGKWDQQSYDSTVSVNTAGPIAVAQALLPVLAPGALIVMVSSTLGQLENVSADYQEAIQAANTPNALKAIPFKPDSQMGSAAPGRGAFAPTYTVAKAMLNKAVQLLVQEEAVKAREARVVATCPGWCRTDMGGSTAERSAEQGAASVLWPYFNWTPSLQGSFTRDGGALPW